MAKQRGDIKRESYSVRLKPDLLLQLKHLAVDERKAVSQLIEEGIEEVLRKYSKKGK
jgi:predicted transcriptional regulator